MGQRLPGDYNTGGCARGKPERPYDASDEWKENAVKTDDELITAKPIAKAAMECRVK